MKRIVKKLANMEYVYEKRDNFKEYITIDKSKNLTKHQGPVLTRQEALVLFRFIGDKLNIGCNECRRFGALNKKEISKLKDCEGRFKNMLAKENKND